MIVFPEIWRLVIGSNHYLFQMNWKCEKAIGTVDFSWTFDDPFFRVLLLRSMAWAADEPVDRFNELVWPGARVGE